MKTLTIKDLARSEQLDGKAMAAVRGGFSLNSPSYKLGNVTYAPQTDASIHGTQDMVQMQEVSNFTANGAAFLDGVSARNRTSQSGQNNIVGGGGVPL